MAAYIRSFCQNELGDLLILLQNDYNSLTVLQ